LFEASLNGNGSLFANPLITKFAASSLNTATSLAASALVSKLAASSLTGSGTLAANLTVGGAFDADAQAFFNRVTTAGGTLSATEQNAVNTLVIALKADGIWTKMKAIYPMVGASAAACAQNLVSASFTGTFSSGFTFASTGVKGNGTNTFMNTNLISQISLQQNSVHLSNYFREFISETRCQFGVSDDSISRYLEVFWNFTGSGVSSRFHSGSITGIAGLVNNDSGLKIMSRTLSNLTKAYNNGISFGSSTTISNGNPNKVIYLFARNSNGNINSPSSLEQSFASIGDGLTDTDASNFYTRVQAFQTTLSRQV
jgi:hypothetical protein